MSSKKGTEDTFMKRFLFFFYFAIVIILVIPWEGSDNSFSDDTKKDRVMAVLPDQSNLFWRGVWDGLRQNEEETSFSISEYEFSDTEEVLQLLDIAYHTEVDGIIFGPKISQSDSVYESLKKLKQKGVKIIVLDTELDTEYYDVFVGIDNANAGRTLGQYLCSKLQPNQQVIAIRSARKLSDTMQERMGAFHEIMEQKNVSNQIRIVEVSLDNPNGIQDILNILSRLDTSVYLVAMGPTYTLYAAEAVAMAGVSDKVQVVGFGETEEALQYVKDNIIEALFVQEHIQLGRKSVMIMEKLLSGQPVTADHDIAIHLVTVDNIEKEI